MFVFAHAFLGALIGLGFWHLTGDRRALPLCILCGVLPDILDKPLALLFPHMFGAGRTVAHALFFVGLAGLLGFLIWQYRHSLLGVACACALFSHQVLDEMWYVPSTWYFPFLGPFGTDLHPDYLVFSFWREISTLSEWVFAFALALIIVIWYARLPQHGLWSLQDRVISTAWRIGCILLIVTGIVLIVPATGLISPTCFAPTYAPFTGFIAGVLALGGVVFLSSRYVPPWCSQ